MLIGISHWLPFSSSSERYKSLKAFMRISRELLLPFELLLWKLFFYSILCFSSSIISRGNSRDNHPPSSSSPELSLSNGSLELWMDQNYSEEFDVPCFWSLEFPLLLWSWARIRLMLSWLWKGLCYSLIMPSGGFSRITSADLLPFSLFKGVSSPSLKTICSSWGESFSLLLFSWMLSGSMLEIEWCCLNKICSGLISLMLFWLESSCNLANPKLSRARLRLLELDS